MTIFLIFMFLTNFRTKKLFSNHTALKTSYLNLTYPAKLASKLIDLIQSQFRELKSIESLQE